MKSILNKQIIVLIFILFVAMFFGITKSSVNIPLNELFSDNYKQILYMRIARVVLGLI